MEYNSLYGTIADIAITDVDYLSFHCVTPILFAVFEDEGSGVLKKYRFKGCGILEFSSSEDDTFLLVGSDITYAIMSLEEIKSGYWIIIEVGK